MQSGRVVACKASSRSRRNERHGSGGSSSEDMFQILGFEVG